ncbi:MAG: hypothetical protein LBS60_07190 [Deltaproteobacteria bacterium]|jgi:hypothetical protein|nr:hypothetical protein [Deltaproteobacteria bacterium]
MEKKPSFIFKAAFLAILAWSLAACSGDKKESEEAAKDQSLVRSGVAAVVGGAVSGAKETLAGVTEGIDEGRKSGQSLDGAILIVSQEDFVNMTKARILKVEDLSQGKYQITLAIDNDKDKPIRLTNLFVDANVVLIDEDGFSYRLPKQFTEGSDVTVLPKSSERVRLTFEGVELKPKSLRIYQIEHELPEAASDNAANPTADRATENASSPTANQ